MRNGQGYTIWGNSFLLKWKTIPAPMMSPNTFKTVLNRLRSHSIGMISRTYSFEKHDILVFMKKSNWGTFCRSNFGTLKQTQLQLANWLQEISISLLKFCIDSIQPSNNLLILRNKFTLKDGSSFNSRLRPADPKPPAS